MTKKIKNNPNNFSLSHKFPCFMGLNNSRIGYYLAKRKNDNGLHRTNKTRRKPTDEYLV